MNKNEIKTQDFVADYYENVRYQEPYSRLYHDWWFKKMIELVNPPADGLILDNGCGTGYLAEFLKNKKIVGLDISLSMLRNAQKRYPFLVNADAQKLPFKDERFDCVFAKALLHHLPEPEKAIQEIRRVLKSGGRVIFCDTLHSLLSALPRRLARKTEHFSKEHKNMREAVLIKLINPYFKIRKIYYFGYIAYPLLGFPDILDVFKYFPCKMFLAKILIRLDELIGKVPLINKQAWGIMVVGDKID